MKGKYKLENQIDIFRLKFRPKPILNNPIFLAAVIVLIRFDFVKNLSHIYLSIDRSIYLSKET